MKFSSSIEATIKELEKHVNTNKSKTADGLGNPEIAFSENPILATVVAAAKQITDRKILNLALTVFITDMM